VDPAAPWVNLSLDPHFILKETVAKLLAQYYHHLKELLAKRIQGEIISLTLSRFQ
jgi:hypothetical protein